MKRIYPEHCTAKRVAVSNAILSFLLPLLSISPLLVLAQKGKSVIPELVFQNPVLVSGNDKAVGAVYRYTSVAEGIDALLEVKQISDPSTIINNIDVTQFGWNKAFQPEVGRPGTVPANQTWWVRFNMRFVKPGTEKKVNLNKFYVTALDVDGDNVSISEFVQMQDPDATNFSALTYLQLLSPLNVGLINKTTAQLTQGPVRNFNNIDTGATAVMATYTYLNKSELDFTVGGTSGLRQSSAGLRMNSLWFKSFDLAPQPSESTLPLHLVDFHGTVSNEQALLGWSVGENETGLSFELQKSIDGAHFSTGALIFTTDKTGEENYQYSERINRPGYYRLKMNNRNNTASFSPVIRLTPGGTSTTHRLALTQNPVTSSLEFSYNSITKETSVVNIYNMNGTKMVSKALNMQKGTNKLQVQLTNEFTAGVYLLELVTSRERLSARFVKQ